MAFDLPITLTAGQRIWEVALSDKKRGPRFMLMMEIAATVLSVVVDLLKKQGRGQG